MNIYQEITKKIIHLAHKYDIKSSNVANTYLSTLNHLELNYASKNNARFAQGDALNEIKRTAVTFTKIYLKRKTNAAKKINFERFNPTNNTYKFINNI